MDSLFLEQGDIFTPEKDEKASSSHKNEPLAARLRPLNFDEYTGQKHILAEGKLLRRAINSDSFTSIILSGPPGVGKTSLAELIARLSNAAFISSLLQRAITDKRGFPDKKITLQKEALAFLAQSCEGDARRALNALEIAVRTTAPDKKGVTNISAEVAHESIQEKPVEYGDDGHYDTASAFIKSMRGSDPDAAVYWLAKMLHAGEDIRFIARRIVIVSSEDIGNADPRAISLAVNAMQAIEMIGMPEARIILAQAVTYCATAPKSNASYLAVDAALDDVRNERVQAVPKHLRDSHYKGAKTMGHGEGYVYPHDKKDHFAVQDYMGVSKKYYSPGEVGYESKIRERMDYWDTIRGKGNPEVRSQDK